MSVEYKPTMKIREPHSALTDLPGAAVEDFDRERRPFNAVHSGQHRRQHVTALLTRASAAVVVEKQRAKLGMTWDELISPADEAEAHAA
jgi:thiamine phosphate synthase YjbQ (UPF0047 family)